MNLEDLRNRLWAMADYAPSGSDEAYIRAQEFLNLAVRDLVLQFPKVAEVERTVYLRSDIVSLYDSADATNQNDAWIAQALNGSPYLYDPWVLDAQFYSTAHPTLHERFTGEGDYFGGWFFEYRDPADTTQIHRHRIRELRPISEDIGGETVARMRMTFFEPLPFDMTVSATDPAKLLQITDWRITARYYPLPADMQDIRTYRVRDGSNSVAHTLDIIEPDLAIERGYDEGFWYSNSSGGSSSGATQPYVAWQGPVDRLPAPRAAPSYSTGSGTWSATEEPQGTFEYAITWGLGHRQDEIQDPNPLASAAVDANASARRLPWIESPMSPITDVIDPAGTTVFLTVPSPAKLFGFNDSNTRRWIKHGIRAYIWRRRVSVVGSEAWPVSNHFRCIGSILQADDGLNFTDDGTKIEGRVYQPATQYQTLRISENVDRRYRLEIRGSVVPLEMKDDTDGMPLPQDAAECVLYRALMFLHEAAGATSQAREAERRYMDSLHVLKRRYGSLRPSGQGRRKRFPRVHRGPRRR